MKCGIKSIDGTLEEFPQTGIIAIIGNSDMYQAILMKEIVKNISSHYKKGMIITRRFLYWATRDFAQNIPHIGIAETNEEDMHKILKEASIASNFNDYQLVVADSVASAGTMLDIISLKNFLEKEKNKLMIVNCNESSGKFDLKSLLVSTALLTLKVEEKTNGGGMNVQISLLGPYLQKIRKSTIPETLPKEEAS